MVQTVLEIVVEGATGLESVHLIQGLLPYPVVSIRDSDGNFYYDSENKKAVDLNGGSNPVWRVLFEFNIDIVEAQQKQLHLIVRLESHRIVPCCPDKYVGEVRVPIEELVKDFGDADEKKSTTRPVLNKKGKARGSLTFTYKFGRTLDHPPAALPQPADGNPVAQIPQPANGNPVAQIPQRYNDGHPIVKAAVGGVTSGLVTSLSNLIRDSL
ncbi:hypothetical protein SO802_027982 [Lithocarpus litseifolius]|uniref:C2 domain-containing protein n=1 Tax=Lithocarpus litseifolius TaxID=425828 RepID=A0AAW2BQ14_9ROSI